MENLRKEIRDHPHKFICDWMEKNLLYVGSRVMRLMALQPCSLILPNIPFNSNSIRASFNVLFIGSPGSGKSTLAKKYSQICYHPYNIRKVTSSKLVEDLSNIELWTLILEDFSQIGNDYDVVKVIEGAVGEERRLSKMTMRDEVNVDTIGVGLMCGTWSDLSKYLEYFKSGLMSRFVFIFLDLTREQKEEIGKYINDGIGKDQESKEAFKVDEVVKEYYQELQSIMNDEHKEFLKEHKLTHKPVEQIIGYHFDPKIKEEIFKVWNKVNVDLIEHFGEGIDFQFTRELHEGYRLFCSSALLNVLNRKVENGIIYPNEEDGKVAIELMKENLKNKVAILKSREFLSKMSSVRDIRSAIDSASPRIKKILYNLASSRFGSMKRTD